MGLRGHLLHNVTFLGFFCFFFSESDLSKVNHIRVTLCKLYSKTDNSGIFLLIF